MFSLGFSLTSTTALGRANFSPLALFTAGEQGFIYDPSDFSTLYQDPAGTTPVTAVGQTVGLVRDKSGRGNHATQSVLASRPILQQDANGKFYLLFDGSDDFLVTPTITPGTDKAQVFAGVRKLSDAAIGVVAELSASTTLNAGTVSLFAPIIDAKAYYGFGSRGSAAQSFAVGTGYAAPLSSVLTGIGDIASDTRVLRVNGTQAASSTSDQGTGDYLAYPLYIGRRGGTTLPFNGRIYGLIARFGPNLSDVQIAQTEQWLNQKTGAF